MCCSWLPHRYNSSLLLVKDYFRYQSYWTSPEMSTKIKVLSSSIALRESLSITQKHTSNLSKSNIGRGIEEWLSVANWPLSLYVMKYTGCFGYFHWSTKICELSHAPLATTYVYFFKVIRHEDMALKCISWLIVTKCSATPISHLRYPLPINQLEPYSH